MRDVVKYHSQILEIRHSLHGLTLQPSLQRIGSTFRLNRRALYKHLTEFGSPNHAEGRSPLMQEVQITSISAFITG
jgi:hypothetical protein